MAGGCDFANRRVSLAATPVDYIATPYLDAGSPPADPVPLPGPSSDAIIVDPISVPELYEKRGFNSQVMSSRIGQEIRGIEAGAQYFIKEDRIALSPAAYSVPDVEVPGTKLGLKTIVELLRQVAGWDQTHIVGDVVLPLDNEARLSIVKAEMTLRLVHGKEIQPLPPIRASVLDAHSLEQLAAKEVVRVVNPVALALYVSGKRDRDEAYEILRDTVQDSSRGKPYIAVAYFVLGYLLKSPEKRDEVIAKSQEKRDEAIVMFRKAIEIDPKKADFYTELGSLLLAMGKSEDAIVELRKAIKVDPKNVDAYRDWGFALEDQKHYEEAITKFQKALVFDPKFAELYYNYWARALEEQGKWAEAATMRKKAAEAAAIRQAPVPAPEPRNVQEPDK